MKTLNKQALGTFNKIISLFHEEGSGKLKSEGFLDLSVERIYKGKVYNDKMGLEIWSFCHYVEENGDLMRDPECLFYMLTLPNGLEKGIFAGSYRNDLTGFSEESIYLDGDTLAFNKSRQADNTYFCNMWMKNLKEQGFLRREAIAA